MSATREQQATSNEVVDTVLTYRRIRYQMKLAELKVRALFPTLSDDDLDRVSGAIESAASGSLAQAMGLKGRLAKKPEPKLLKKTSKKKPTMSPADRKRANAGRQAVADGTRPSLREALITVLGASTLSTVQVLERLEKRKWLPNSKDAYSYVGQVLASTPKLFKKVKSKGRGYYCVRRLKGAKPKTGLKNKTSRKLESRAKKVDNSKVVHFLIQHGKPITSPEVAKNFGLLNGAPLAPLFASLRKHGALKRHESKEGALWEPITEKLHNYQTEHKMNGLSN